MADDITFCGETSFRDQRRRFGIKTQDRTKHMYIIGKTGMGKTTLLENMAIQDIRAGNGVGVVDPHGEFAEKMLNFVPKERIRDIIYFNPADLQYPVSFNALERVLPEQRHLVASGLLGVFKKIWPDVWSARMEYLLSNSILALLEIPGSTLLGINRMFSDKEFRKSIVSQLTDPVVRAFWEKEYAQYQERFATEASAAIQNKVGQFISNPLIRNIVGQENSAVDMRNVMDEGKILIMNLSKGRIGEENSRLLGAMLVTKIYLRAMTRVDVPEPERRDFYLYVDEFQNFATESFASILSEARKYRLSLIMAHQYIAQMDEKVRDAVIGNVGTMTSFRIGAQDAEILEKEFGPEFMTEDLVNLGFAQVYMKLMIDGITSRPFSALTLPPLPAPAESYREEIIKLSRERYGSNAEEVREKIEKFHGLQSNVGPEAGFDRSRPQRKEMERPVKERKLYEAHCIVDGEPTMVPFVPDGRRPVYCEKHLEMLRRGEAMNVPKSRAGRGEFPERQSFRPPPIRNRPLPGRSPAPRGLPETKPLSLKELKPKESVRETSPERPARAEEAGKNTVRPQVKKEVDLEGLRKILNKSLEDAPKEAEGAKESGESSQTPKEKNNRSGVIKPGEKITFK